MKKIILSFVLMLLISTSLFSQDWTPPEHGKTRIGLVGNIWHPYGLMINHDFGGLGAYVTAKAAAEFHPEFELRQYNFTAGLSIPIFKNTSRSSYSDLLVGVSYVTDMKGNYRNHCYQWGGEVLLMLPFTDRNFRVLAGWSSNSIIWSEGFTAGFLYQF